MGIYDNLDNGKWGKPANGGIFAALDKKTGATAVKPTFKDRLLGAPVKQADGTFNATTGAVPFIFSTPKAIFDVAKGFVQGTTSVGKTLGQSIAVNTGAFKGLDEANKDASDIKLNLVNQIRQNKSLGKDTSGREGAFNLLNQQDTQTSQTLAPSTTKTNARALGDIIMMATEVLMPGEAGVKGKTGALLARDSIKKYLASRTVSEMEKVMAKKAIFNIASGYGYDVSSNFSDGKNGVEAFKPGIATLLSSIFTGAEIKGMIAGSRVAEKSIMQNRALGRANFGPIPGVGVPLPGYQNPGIKQLPAPRTPTDFFQGPAGVGRNIHEATNIRTKPGGTAPNKFNSVPGGYDTPKGNIYTPDADLPVITAKDIKRPAKNEFNANTQPPNIKTSILNKVNSSEGVPRTIETPFDVPKASEFRPVKEGEILPTGATTKFNVETGEMVTNAPLKETDIKLSDVGTSTEKISDNSTPKQEIPNQKGTTQKQNKFTSEQIESSAEKLGSNKEFKGRNKITLKDQSEKSYKFIEDNGIDGALKALEDGTQLPGNLKPDALHSILSNIADETGDGKLLIEVARLRPSISGESAQRLVTNRLKNPDSASAVIEDILFSFAAKKPFLTRTAEKVEKRVIIKKLEDAVARFTDSKENIMNALKEIIC